MSALRGSRILLRAVNDGDLARLLEILREPDVASHWGPPDDDFDRRELLAGDDPDGAERISTFVIDLR
ncbi:MAG: hypothetical protein ABIP39_10360 [Polyangiaceae bacterium]